MPASRRTSDAGILASSTTCERRTSSAVRCRTLGSHLTFVGGDRMVSVSAAQRRALHDELVKKLGAAVADTLMEYLPPTGWSEVARRSDVDNLGQSQRLEMQALESRLRAHVSDTITSQTRWFMASQLVLVAATIGSITAIAH